VVVDTGVLLAALDANDPRHSAAIATLAGRRTSAPVVPAPILGELDYWFRKRAIGGAWMALCEDIAAGRYALHDLGPSVLLDAAKYADLRLGFVDAAVFLTCVELHDGTVATFDHRHFSVLRTEDGRALEVVP